MLMIFLINIAISKFGYGSHTVLVVKQTKQFSLPRRAAPQALQLKEGPRLQLPAGEEQPAAPRGGGLGGGLWGGLLLVVGGRRQRRRW